jgi:hypothetical protein
MLVEPDAGESLSRLLGAEGRVAPVEFRTLIWLRRPLLLAASSTSAAAS